MAADAAGTDASATPEASAPRPSTDISAGARARVAVDLNLILGFLLVLTVCAEQAKQAGRRILDTKHGSP